MSCQTDKKTNFKIHETLTKKIKKNTEMKVKNIDNLYIFERK